MQDYKQILVWKKAIGLTVKIYKLTATFPKSEVYGLSSQIQRASVSISCNISEGAGKSSRKDFNRFLEMAYGSANEVENLLIIATEIKYIKEVESSIYVSDVQEIRKMLNGLMKSLTKY
jgi:four helix bundle protein